MSPPVCEVHNIKITAGRKKPAVKQKRPLVADVMIL